MLRPLVIDNGQIRQMTDGEWGRTEKRYSVGADMLRTLVDEAPPFSKFLVRINQEWRDMYYELSVTARGYCRYGITGDYIDHEYDIHGQSLIVHNTGLSTFIISLQGV